MNEPIPYFDKLKGIIDSCNNPEHINSCKIVMELYEVKHGFTHELSVLVSLLMEREAALKDLDNPILRTSETY